MGIKLKSIRFVSTLIQLAAKHTHSVDLRREHTKKLVDQNGTINEILFFFSLLPIEMIANVETKTV